MVDFATERAVDEIMEVRRMALDALDAETVALPNFGHVNTGERAFAAVCHGDSLMENCVLDGDVEIGEYSVMHACVVRPGAKVRIGDGACVAGCQFCGDVVVEDGCALVEVALQKGSLHVGRNSTLIGVGVDRGMVELGEDTRMLLASLEFGNIVGRSPTRAKIGSGAVLHRTYLEIEAEGDAYIGRGFSAVSPDIADPARRLALTSMEAVRAHVDSTRGDAEQSMRLSVRGRGDVRIGDDFRLHANLDIRAKSLRIGDGVQVFSDHDLSGGGWSRSWDVLWLGDMSVGSGATIIPCNAGSVSLESLKIGGGSTFLLLPTCIDRKARVEVPPGAVEAM